MKSLFLPIWFLVFYSVSSFAFPSGNGGNLPNITDNDPSTSATKNPLQKPVDFCDQKNLKRPRSSEISDNDSESTSEDSLSTSNTDTSSDEDVSSSEDSLSTSDADMLSDEDVSSDESVIELSKRKVSKKNKVSKKDKEENIKLETEKSNRVEVNKEFFNSTKYRFVAKSIDEKLEKFKKAYDFGFYEPIDITGLSSRARIELLRKIIEYKRKTIPKRGGGFWMIREFFDCKPTVFKTGRIEHVLYINPTDSQPGNGEVVELGKYKKIVKNIQRKNDENDAEYKKRIERYIKLLLIQRKYGDLINTGNDTESEFLNRLNLLLDFEVARRCIDSDKYETLPVLIHIEHVIRNLDKWPDFNKTDPSKILSLFDGDYRYTAEANIAVQNDVSGLTSKAVIRQKLESSHKLDEYSDNDYSAAEDQGSERRKRYFKQEKNSWLKTIKRRYRQDRRNNNGENIKASMVKDMFEDIFIARNETDLSGALAKAPKSSLRDEAEYLVRKLLNLPDKEIASEKMPPLEDINKRIKVFLEGAKPEDGVFSHYMENMKSCYKGYAAPALVMGAIWDKDVDLTEIANRCDLNIVVYQANKDARHFVAKNNDDYTGKVYLLDKNSHYYVCKEGGKILGNPCVNCIFNKTEEVISGCKKCRFEKMAQNKFPKGMAWNGDIELEIIANLCNLNITIYRTTERNYFNADTPNDKTNNFYEIHKFNTNTPNDETTNVYLFYNGAHYLVCSKFSRVLEKPCGRGNCLFHAILRQIDIARDNDTYEGFLLYGDAVEACILYEKVVGELQKKIKDDNPIRAKFRQIIYANDENELIKASGLYRKDRRHEKARELAQRRLRELEFCPTKREEIGKINREIEKFFKEFFPESYVEISGIINEERKDIKGINEVDTLYDQEENKGKTIKSTIKNDSLVAQYIQIIYADDDVDMEKASSYLPGHLWAKAKELNEKRFCEKEEDLIWRGEMLFDREIIDAEIDEFLKDVSKNYIEIMKSLNAVVWCGDIELGIIANLYNRNIIVHRNNGKDNNEVIAQFNADKPNHEGDVHILYDGIYYNVCDEHGKASDKLIERDSNNLFRAIVLQIVKSGINEDHAAKEMREKVANYLKEKTKNISLPTQDDNNPVIARFKRILEANNEFELAIESGFLQGPLLDEAQELARQRWKALDYESDVLQSGRRNDDASASVLFSSNSNSSSASTLSSSSTSSTSSKALLVKQTLGNTSNSIANGNKKREKKKEDIREYFRVQPKSKINKSVESKKDSSPKIKTFADLTQSQIEFLRDIPIQYINGMRNAYPGGEILWGGDAELREIAAEYNVRIVVYQPAYNERGKIVGTQPNPPIGNETDQLVNLWLDRGHYENYDPTAQKSTHDTPGIGNCLYHAVLRAMHELGRAVDIQGNDLDAVSQLRTVVADRFQRQVDRINSHEQETRDGTEENGNMPITITLTHENHNPIYIQFAAVFLADNWEQLAHAIDLLPRGRMRREAVNLLQSGELRDAAIEYISMLGDDVSLSQPASNGARSLISSQPTDRQLSATPTNTQTPNIDRRQFSADDEMIR